MARFRLVVGVLQFVGIETDGGRTADFSGEPAYGG
jgi:hypothetical protein